MKATCTTVRKYCRFDDDLQIQLEQGFPVMMKSVVQVTCALCMPRQDHLVLDLQMGVRARDSNSLAFTIMQETRLAKSSPKEYSSRASVTIATYSLVKTEAMPVGDSFATGVHISMATRPDI